MDRVYKKKVKTGHRYFLAILPDKDTRVILRDVQRKITKHAYKLGFINLEQIHLTLKFLGNNVSDKSTDTLLEMLKAELKRMQISPFKVTLENLEFGFGNEILPKTVHFSAQDSMEMDQIIGIIHDTVKKIQVIDIIKRRDNPRFIGHITVARVKRDISKSHTRQIREQIKEISVPSFEFITRSIYLIESQLTKTGPVYKIIKKIDLQ